MPGSEILEYVRSLEAEPVVVVLTALDLEHEAVLAHLVSAGEVEHPAGTLFELGRFPGCPGFVAVAVTTAGNNAAATLAERAIAFFRPAAVLLIGVAGALHDDLNIGDVVVATRVYAFHGGRADDESPLQSRPRAWDAPHNLEQRARSISRAGAWKRMLPQGSGEPVVRFGPIAAGEVVLDSRDTPLFRWLRQHFNDAAAIDMEGAGVALAAHLNRSVPVLVVRGISDRADGHKEQADRAGSQHIAAAHAAAFGLTVATAVLERIGNPMVVPVESGVLLLARAEPPAPRGRLSAGAAILDRSPVVHPALARNELVTTDAPVHAAHPPPPRQLPPLTRHFTGRAAELQALDHFLEWGEDATALIFAIGGMAGIGKTALALHWAHRVADRYPDGQLYVNLRGFDPRGQVVGPDEALRRFLDALGVPPERIPADPEAQAALYRSLLAGRRVIIVLDNARDSVHVRPLLPGAAACLVLVTSRNQLTGLVAADGAVPIHLDLLTPAEARDLLARRIGAERVAAEPAAVDEIVELCARLPLALAIVAARAATDPRLPLHTLADRLFKVDDRLDTLTTDDPATDVRAVFSWSYQALTPPAGRLFRLLGLHPGPAVSVHAAASLAGLAVSVVLRLLAELVRANLIAESAPERYTFHDLLRAYATDRVHAEEPEEQRRAAVRRMVDHYLHTAYAADRLLHPGRDELTLEPAEPGVATEPLTGYQQALDWFTSERAVLLAIVEQAAAAGFDAHTWQLAWTLAPFLDRREHWRDLAGAGRAAIATAQRLADPPAQTYAHRLLARAYIQLNRAGDAHAELRSALRLATAAKDPEGQANVHHALAFMWEKQGRHADALHHAQQTLELYRLAGHRRGQARALNNIGWCHILLGDHQRALTACEQALDLLQDLGDRYGQASAWDSLGHARRHLGHHALAVSCFQHAVDLYRGLRDRHLEAKGLTHLGDAQLARDDPDAAGEAWREALSIMEDLNRPDTDTESVRGKLAAIGAGQKAY